MVLGLGQKHSKGPSVRVEYVIHIQDIKPWPPSQSLRSLRSVVIQWENGEKTTGSTSPVVPSLDGTGANDGKIEFDETFRLPVTLLRDTTVKSGDAMKFRKKCLELHLYEVRRDKTSRGQLIGTAIIDLADHGVIKESRTVSAAMNCQRNFRNTAQPVLHVKILPASKTRVRSASMDNSSIQALLDGRDRESVSALIKEQYAQEAERTSLTVDDAPSQSSATVPGTPLACNDILPLKKEMDEPHDIYKCVGRDDDKCTVVLKPEEGLKSSHAPPLIISESLKPSSSCSTSVDLFSDSGSVDNSSTSCSSSPTSSSSPFLEKVTDGSHSPVSSLEFNVIDEKSNAVVAIEDCGSETPNQSETPDGSVPEASDHEEIAMVLDCKESVQENAIVPSMAPVDENFGAGNFCNTPDNEDDKRTDDKRTDTTDQVDGENPIRDEPVNSNGSEEVDQVDGEKSVEDVPVSCNGTGENDQAVGEKSIENDTVNSQSDADSELHFPALDDRENHEIDAATASAEKSKYLKSVRSTPDLNRNNGVANGSQSVGDRKWTATRSFKSNERYVFEYPTKDTRSRLLESKVQQLENKIQMLEDELREAAAIEFALFSVVAEHGSSHAKVHAPARRLSRLYFYACKQRSQSRRASAAKSAVSGLVLMAKACGNDVSRLTYWLSNSVMLRVLVSQRMQNMELSLSSMDRSRKNSSVSDGVETPSLFRWNSCCSSNKLNDENFATSYDLEDPRAFVSALEKVEAWIFSRTVELIWWQTFTPYMQSSSAALCNVQRDPGSCKSNGDVVNENDAGHGDYSLEMWRTAFKDAFKRLCPVRSGALECGCLQMLPRLVMEQCIARLDGAIFNSILRESPDVSMDLVADTVSDPKVLPIQAGQSSFGTGAQLKTVIGNWSRCLTELFGAENDCMSAQEEMDVHDHGRNDASFKCFHLLSAVSDLMMLPKDMLLSESVRKEVCPMFGTSMIRTILHNFVPDEFCPDPIPDAVFDSLDSGNHVLDGEDSNVIFPYIPPPTTYLPPSAVSVVGEAGHLISGSSALAKSNASDDELEELNSPLATISIDQRRSLHGPTKLVWISKQRGYQDVALRYELLRDTWKSSR